MRYEPKQMHHPAFDPGQPARFRLANGELAPVGHLGGEMVERGTACRFPPITVTTQDEEDDARSRGYLMKGETAPKVDGYYEYPKMLVHPDHVPGTLDEIHAKPRVEGQALETFLVKGRPEVLPPVTVSSAEEEAEWNAKGYHMPRLMDPRAFQKSRAVPYKPGQTVQAYPRWENGVLVSDPKLNSAGRQEYPKWVGNKIVNSAKEEFETLEGLEFTDARIEYMISERRVHSQSGNDEAVERIEKMLADHNIEVKDRPHGTVWKRLDPPVPHEDESARQALIAEAEGKGIKVDKRWGINRLRAALNQSAAE